MGVAYASVRVRPRLQNGDVAGAQPREAKGRLQWASEEDDCLEAEKQQEGGRRALGESGSGEQESRDLNIRATAV